MPWDVLGVIRLTPAVPASRVGLITPGHPKTPEDTGGRRRTPQDAFLKYKITLKKAYLMQKHIYMYCLLQFNPFYLNINLDKALFQYEYKFKALHNFAVQLFFALSR